MKVLTLVFLLVGLLGRSSEEEKIESKVYSFAKAVVQAKDNGENRSLIHGETTHLMDFEIDAVTLFPGKRNHKMHEKEDYEKIVFIKDGILKVTTNEKTETIGPGSVALIMPNTEYEVVNESNLNSTYFLIQYKTKLPNNTRAKESALSSMLINWDNIAFRPHDKGGQRKFFDQKSVMSDRIEMHATTLNPAIKSHEPHTHGPAEIVIMMKGTTEMEIGDGVYAGVPRDLYFLGSNIPHAIRNTGTEPSMCLTFEWQQTDIFCAVVIL